MERDAAIAALARELAGQGALAGLKVVDLSRVLAGPLCSMMLGDHGADVIKVEPPQGDDTRRWGPPFASTAEGAQGDASYYLGLNRNKRAIGLDLNQAEGRAVLMTLLEDADILIENFKSGTMEAWGLGYETDLAPRFPRLIHCRITGFGSNGPLAGLPGYDAVAQAMSGLMSVNGDVSTGPMRVGVPVADYSTAFHATIGILMALHERTRSGRGQLLDMALYDGGMALLHPHAPNYFLNGKRPELLGNTHPNVVPCDKFATRDGAVFLVGGNAGQLRRLGEVLDLPDLMNDPRFATNEARAANRVALTELLAERFLEREAIPVSIALLQAGVPVGPVLPIDVSLEAEHTRAREMVVEFGGYRGIGTPVKMSRTPAVMRRVPPRFGQDSVALLAEHGFDAAHIERLQASGVVPRKMR